MTKNTLLGITLTPQTRKEVLEKIEKYIHTPGDFFHIVSLNPENLLASLANIEFKKVIETARVKIVDGVGIVLASKLLGTEAGDRITGVDLMRELLIMANGQRSRVLLIGGGENLSLNLSKCYSRAYVEAKFMGMQGIRNIKKPLTIEESILFSIVSSFKPHFIFAAFGSPDQELWLWRHRDKLKGIVCMGVGGGFDYESGRVVRAPKPFRFLGFEWLFRLIFQPWRWRRQIKLIKFVWLVLKQRFNHSY